MRLAVVGLGKLGAPMAAVLASAGHTVIGIDSAISTVDTLNANQPPVDEPGLRELLVSVRGSLTATTEYGPAVSACDASFVVVPTPSVSDGSFSLKYATEAVEAIGRVLAGADQSRRHTVVITSTVGPGSTDGPIRQALERSSRRLLGRGLGLCYSPEFIALGTVISDLRNPDFLLIGSEDRSSGALVEKIFSSVVPPNTPGLHMSTVDAELAKIAVNTFVTTKISYANMLAEVCENTPGANADVVLRAVGADRRIGPAYLRAATGYGGPCFPRDNAALTAYANAVGVSADLAQSTDRINRRQSERLHAILASKAASSSIVGILGLAYKQGSSVVEESPGLHLARRLIASKTRPLVFDPVALPNAVRVLGDSVDVALSSRDCLERADVVVIPTPWPDFRDPDLYRDLDVATRKCIVDCWGVVPAEVADSGLEVYRVGVGASTVRSYPDRRAGEPSEIN